MPDFLLEDTYEGKVCGIDEVGRGPLAGPVVSACVYIPANVRDRGFIAGLNDSKKLSLKKRESLFEEIIAHCVYGIGLATVEEIDDINILQATLLSMKRAYIKMDHGMEAALIDGNQRTRLTCKQQTVKKGDTISSSIAAASIIAKVTRDRMMADYDKRYPGYGWASNAGYGSAAHMEALKELGVTPLHRRSFAPVRTQLEIEGSQGRIESA
ncbi:MAG: ribonuclease HII [Micavibrio sp.]|nr:ribonuclease HII [Micavibrio sp.]|tara:strand:- start:309077 stop:309712 length:636 start_codon:yes stop_codon:yes gene_type:complete